MQERITVFREKRKPNSKDDRSRLPFVAAARPIGQKRLGALRSGLSGKAEQVTHFGLFCFKVVNVFAIRFGEERNALADCQAEFRDTVILGRIICHDSYAGHAKVRQDLSAHRVVSSVPGRADFDICL